MSVENPSIPPTESSSPAPIVESTPAAPVVASSSFFTGKVVAIIIGVLVVAGGAGAYMYFNFNSNGSSDLSATDNVKSDKNAGNFSCKDLLPDPDFNRIMGKNVSGYEFIEEDNDPTKGEGILPTGDVSLYKQGSRLIICSYLSSGAYLKMAVAGDVVFALASTGEDMTTAFEIGRDPYKSYPEGRSKSEFAGKTIEIEKIGNQVWFILSPEEAKFSGTDKMLATTPKIIDGIGAGAYEEDGQITFLSINHKYIVTIMQTKGVADEVSAKIELAKIINSNLNKY